jgi:2'-5' RNA ligase
MRLFTALNIPDALRADLSGLQDADALDARWTDPEQFHITLRFIGEVPEEQAVRYEQALADVTAPPVQCVPYGLDVLPSRRSPRVVMLGLDRTDSMMTLYAAVSDALESEGLDPEDRTYRPHVTIGRLDDADPEAVHTFLRRHEDRSFSSFEADRFTLYESTLTSEGATHDPQATYPLRP